jgi:hypothetical protein
MKPKIFLRIASVLMLLHTVGHTLGALSWRKAPNAAVQKVITAMESNRFQFMGRSASLADFYSGYGIIMIGVLLLITVLLWLGSDETDVRSFRKVQTLLTAFLVFLAVIEYIYFFPFAAAFSLLAGICTLISLRR